MEDNDLVGDISFQEAYPVLDPVSSLYMPSLMNVLPRLSPVKPGTGQNSRMSSPLKGAQQPKWLPSGASRSSAILNIHSQLTDCILSLQRVAGGFFQRKFSQYVRVVDIPMPIEKHPEVPVPVWPPEPVFFNNILDVYADRRRLHRPMHTEDFVLSIYDGDMKANEKKGKLFDLFAEMDAESEDERTGNVVEDEDE